MTCCVSNITRTDTLDVGQAPNAGSIAQQRFPYDHNVGLGHLQAVNGKLNELEEYRAEATKKQNTVAMRR